jgi:hypothetical protein
MLICRHCGKEIRYKGDVLFYLHRYEYYHPDLVDGAIDGVNRDGTYCNSEMEFEAEP